MRVGEGRYDIFVGRPSPWANPFRHGADGTREEVNAKFARWVERTPSLATRIRRELRGKILGSWEKPENSHALILARIANEPTERTSGGDTRDFRRGR